jgi:hypothetical protein
LNGAGGQAFFARRAHVVSYNMQLLEAIHFLNVVIADSDI